jgi:hypothetical protein
MACATVVGDNTATTANAAAEHQQGQEVSLRWPCGWCHPACPGEWREASLPRAVERKSCSAEGCHPELGLS